MHDNFDGEKKEHLKNEDSKIKKESVITSMIKKNYSWQNMRKMERK